MRTPSDFLHRSAGRPLLETIISAATTKGLHHLCLETGTGPAFDAAVALYTQRGFVPGKAFGSYASGTFNRFFYLKLAGNNAP